MIGDGEIDIAHCGHQADFRHELGDVARDPGERSRRARRKSGLRAACNRNP